jgi:hypothetical protein
MSSDDEPNWDLDRANTKVREQRREEAEREWKKNPVEQFAKLKRRELSEDDVNKYMRAVRRFETYLLNEIAPESDMDISNVRDAVRGDVEVYRDNDLIPDDDLSDIGVHHYLRYLSHFYNIAEEHSAIVGNPVEKPLKEFTDSHDTDSNRPYIPFERMQTFLNWLTLPFWRAFWVAGIKHGTRLSEVINIDLRCLHIDHPIFWEIVDNHDVQLDPRIRNLPDTILIYEGFNKGTEVPNENTPGSEKEGEIREQGNKRSEIGGSVLPVDSEFKTALIDWLISRPPTYELTVNPLFVADGTRKSGRIADDAVMGRLYQNASHTDSIQNFADQERISKCTECGGRVTEENPTSGDKTGRRFRCQSCRQDHWRSIYWDTGLDTEQKVTYHVARHYFTNLHDPQKTELHDGAIPDKVRKKRIRGDSEENGDTEDDTYKDKSYESYDTDIRQPYLDGVAKFDIYDEVIPAVGEGWEQ